MNCQSSIQLNELITVLEEFRSSLPSVGAAGSIMALALRSGGKLLTCGNGGSAADALHLSEELVGRFLGNRPSLASICLSADPTLLTCIGNDYGFESLFSRQVEGLGREGDVLVLFSSSGNSMNLVRALEVANKKGLITIAALGKDGGRCCGLATYEIIVPSHVTARVQEVHGLMIHLWLTIIESTLGYS
jgi:D-sedoheptulose 7-phosphate isomerase